MSKSRSPKHHTSKPPSQRQLRVGEEIRHALAWTLERGEVHDETLSRTPITVTEVRASPDLKNATAFVVPLGGGDVEPVLKALRRAKPFLRHEVARKVALKFVPDLSFEPDVSFDNAAHIDNLLHRPEVARDLDKMTNMGDMADMDSSDDQDETGGHGA